MSMIKNGFNFVYIAVFIATFQHTVWASALTFEGLQPSTNEISLELVRWYFSGVLVAIAIDAGMYVTAHTLRNNRSFILAFAFLIAALASAYTQLLYVSHHATELSFGDGVNSFWQEKLKAIIEARVFIMPLLLPLFSIVYTISGITVEEKEREEDNKKTLHWTCKECNRHFANYKTKGHMQRAMKVHFKKTHGKEFKEEYVRYG